MTGAGRSTAAKELEDLGYYVVDNLPPTLLRDVVRLVDESRGVDQPIAVVVDVRSGSFFESLQANLAQRRHRAGVRRCCSSRPTDDVLVRRQEAARRPHPLQGSGRLLDGLHRERERAGRPARRRRPGHRHLRRSTSTSSPTRSREPSARRTPRRLKVTVVSFGFKYGIPVDADFVADMRFLPNPYWVPELRPQTGRDADVARLRHRARPAPRSSSTATCRCCSGVAEGYLREGKRFMTVAIGCTGGKHRSVAMTEEIARRLRREGYDARAAHRDLGRE